MATYSDAASVRIARASVIGLASLGMSLAASAFVSPTLTQAGPGSIQHASFTDARWGDSLADALAQNFRGQNTADSDPGSLYTIERAIGARTVWQQRDSANRQITGKGVTVALL